MQSFMPIRSFVFKIQTIKNGIAGPKSFRDIAHLSMIGLLLVAPKATDGVNLIDRTIGLHGI